MPAWRAPRRSAGSAWMPERGVAGPFALGDAGGGHWADPGLAPPAPVDGAQAAVPPGPADAPCTVLHLDMDAFFASIEVLDDPSLAGRPVIVGGDGPRGAVASCSYEARAYGVRSAMASVEARRRCPHAVFRPGRHDRYVEVSSQLGSLLREVTPIVEPIGLDEAFLDVAGAARRLGSPGEIARALRDRVHAELGLTCAVGVARTKSLAKLASRQAKVVAPARRGPADGVVVVLPADEGAFLHPLPVGALWGVGPATAVKLASLGVTTVGQLAEIPDGVLARLVGRAAGSHLAALAAGRDTGRVQPHRPVRSIGRETTLADDAHDPGSLAGLLASLAADVGQRLAAGRLAGRCVTLKVRFADRRTVTRSVTPAVPAGGPHQVLSVARSLLAQVDVAAGVRLLGVSASQLVPADAVAVQQPLGGWSWPAAAADPAAADPVAGDPEAGDAAAGERWRQVDSAVVRLRQRFGPAAVVPAVTVAVPADGHGVPVEAEAEAVAGSAFRGPGERTRRGDARGATTPREALSPGDRHGDRARDKGSH